MIGIVDVGGGTRGIYGCGVFDRCLDERVQFDFVIGVSAGSANAVAYLAGQRGRNYVFYHDYAFRPEYMGPQCFLRTGSFVGLEYIYGTLTNSDGEYPLDFDALQRSPAMLEIVATNAKTGDPVYFRKGDMRQDDYGCIKASSCVPGACRPYYVDGVPYYDGGISDPIPFRRAFLAGCDKVVIVLTKPVGTTLSRKNPMMASKVIRRRYPRAAKKTAEYNALYSQQLQQALELEKQGKVQIIAPDSVAGFQTMTRDKSGLETLYQKGYADAAAIRTFVQA